MHLTSRYLASPCPSMLLPPRSRCLIHARTYATRTLSVCTSAVCRHVRPDRTGLRADHNPIPIHSGPHCPSFSRSYPPFMKLFHLVGVSRPTQPLPSSPVSGCVGASFHRARAQVTGSYLSKQLVLSNWMLQLVVLKLLVSPY